VFVNRRDVRAGLDPPAYQEQMLTVNEEGGHIGPPLQKNGKNADEGRWTEDKGSAITDKKEKIDVTANKKEKIICNY